jgi:putative SOS response-associated peptidase YedK
MCGRFAQPRSSDELARLFGASVAAALPADRFNVAPTDEVAAVVERRGERTVGAFRWGLVPVWSASPRDGSRMINARSETVETSTAFRTAFRRHRCIVPADAFYEWERVMAPGRRRPLRSEPSAIRRSDGEPLAFAGLWAVWHDPATGARLLSATILTTVANEVVAPVHDRMPVILHGADWDAWLDETSPPEALRPLLRPAPEEGMVRYAVSPAVNNVRSQGAELLLPRSRWTDVVAADA